MYTILGKGESKISKLQYIHNPDLKAITFDKTVNAIEHNAFCYCDKLEKVAIPNSISIIEEYAFRNGNVLEAIEFENLNNDITIGEGAFSDNLNLNEIKLPIGLKSVSELMLYGCTNLEKIEIPDTVTDIKEEAFSYCLNMKNIKFPNDLKSIGVGAFKHTNINKLILPDSIEEIKERAFSICVNLTEIYLPHSLKIIETGVFEANRIKEIIIPENVKIIEPYAFGSCELLERIIFENDFPYISSGAFKQCQKLHTIQFNKPDVKIDRSEFNVFKSKLNIEMIIGYSNSDAEIIANTYNLKFVPIQKSIYDLDGFR